MAMFPSQRSGQSAWVSARNVPKPQLSETDFVHVRLVDGGIRYTGSRKPSVDTPIQLRLYQEFPGVSCMIHGHALVRGAPSTESYVPCGDLREFEGVAKLMRAIGDTGCVNLKAHGFLIFAPSVPLLSGVVGGVKFVNLVPLPGRPTHE
jgi:hypothetical protein